MALKEEIKAGIIVVVSLVILSGSVILIGGSSLFEKSDKYYVRFMNAAGLETGAQVRLGGVRVGRVTNVYVPDKPGEPVTVELGLKRGTLLYKGTRAQVSQIGFVGDIFLLLAVKDTTNERIRPGDTIPSDEKIELDALVSKVSGLSQSVDTLIRDADKLFNQKNLKGIETLIDNTNTAIVSGSSNLDKVAASLKGTTERLDRVLNEVEGVVHGNKAEVTLLIKKAREDIEKAEGMIKSIESTAKSVEKTSNSADRLITRQSKNLDSLMNTMTRTTEELQELLQEIKNKPWSIIYREKRGE
jgi:phospholipid/cholesterol/gamma-HCH transport system substrate-binding protein